MGRDSLAIAPERGGSVDQVGRIQIDRPSRQRDAARGQKGGIVHRHQKERLVGRVVSIARSTIFDVEGERGFGDDVSAGLGILRIRIEPELGRRGCRIGGHCGNEEGERGHHHHRVNGETTNPMRFQSRHGCPP